MKVSELKETNVLYDKNVAEWKFLMACYEGAKELIALGYLNKHERESQDNYNRRKDEAYGFSYSKSVVDLLSFYLFKKPVKRSMGDLQEDEQWGAFVKDANLYGDSFDFFLLSQARYASIMGSVGILVDKPSVEKQTRAEELNQGIYPYVASYFPTAILDWRFDRDENNRPFLAFLKLKDDDNKFILWYPEKWEKYKEPDDDKSVGVPKSAAQEQTISSSSVGEQEAELVDSGPNPLCEIPFVWLYNMRGKTIPIGVSDIHDVARIDVSILRNLSQGEEVINYAAFPMMRRPMQEQGTSQAADEVGVTAVLEFDPEHPDSKPDWLDASVEEPIDAILKWMARKVEEIYRASNAGGMAATEISTVAKSGVALKTEFQLLNSKLVSKAINLEKAETRIIDLWSKWQDQEKNIENVSIERERTYDVENLSEDLENAMTSMTVVKSKSFLEAIRKMVARQMLPALTDDQLRDIDKEIEEIEEIEPTAESAFNEETGGPNPTLEDEEEEE